MVVSSAGYATPDGSNTSPNDRTLGLAGAPNFRDIGGYPGANGKHVRWGIVYRSNQLSELTAADADKVVDDYVLTEKLVPAATAAAQSAVPVGGAAASGGTAASPLAQLPVASREALWRSDPAYISAALDSIGREYGSMDSYVERELGVTKMEIRAIRAKLLQ